MEIWTIVKGFFEEFQHFILIQVYQALIAIIILIVNIIHAAFAILLAFHIGGLLV